MLHDIAPHIFRNEFSTVTEVRESDYILYYKSNSLLVVKKEDENEIPHKSDLPEFSSIQDAIFLFTLDDKACFLLLECPVVNEDGFVYEEINFFRNYKRREIAWISILGHQLMSWYSSNRFCGNCGSKTTLKTTERAIQCTDCATTLYPKISPAVIVAITCKNKILLASGKNFRSNFYSLIAGYVDIGESLEETVVREVKEEIGIDVKNIRYYKSQPWPFSGSMMIGYWAEADDLQPLRLDENEISEAGWYSRGNLPNHPVNISIAGEMIELFEKNMM